MRRAVLALALLLLAACAATPTRPAHVGQPGASASNSRDNSPKSGPVTVNPCAPTRRHLDSDYTPGGLYAPGVADGGPASAIDVSGVAEPVPRREQLARTGNRTPYSVLGQVYHVMDSAKGYHERGLASWYGTKFNGRSTSSGELYDMCMFSAAHRTLPLPSFVRVTNLDNGRSLVVRVNDRGPFHSARVMDLSYAAAVRLGVDRTGTAHVDLRALDEDDVEDLIEVGRRAASRADSTIVSDHSSNPVGARQLIQVGSFGDHDNATRLAKRLRHADVAHVDIDRVNAGGQTLWRVRIGPVATQALAQLLQRLRELDLPNPRVFSE